MLFVFIFKESLYIVIFLFIKLFFCCPKVDLNQNYVTDLFVASLSSFVFRNLFLQKVLWTIKDGDGLLMASVEACRCLNSSVM